MNRIRCRHLRGFYRRYLVAGERRPCFILDVFLVDSGETRELLVQWWRDHGREGVLGDGALLGLVRAPLGLLGLASVLSAL